MRLTAKIFKEGKTYVSFNPELRVASCGPTIVAAKSNLLDALRGFLLSAREMGTLSEIMEEAGFVRKNRRWVELKPLKTERLSLAV